MDADLSFPNAAGTLSCALEAPITEDRTPHLYALLRRTLTDAGLSTYGAKNRYQRVRPFIANKEAICTPEDQTAIAADGSYPSGHTAVGWAWALILTEIAPERADAILARGMAYGESRNVCNVDWHSDVVEGRVMGAATLTLYRRLSGSEEPRQRRRQLSLGDRQRSLLGLQRVLHLRRPSGEREESVDYGSFISLGWKL